MTDKPTKFGRYQVKGVIGKGAMGVIYLAEDPVIGRQVAIKVIQLNAGLSTAEIEGLKTRFEREFRSAGTLSHPNIVTVHDVGTEGSEPYIAMEYVEGKTLEHVINEQRVLSFEEIADLVAQIADALDFAHEHGVVHRDVKPANILLDRAGRPKITDFGVAKLTESGMTHTGTMVGTPWYMSPEQVVGEAVTGAADQFSVAVMTYQLLTRERPFTGERSSTVLYKIVHEEPVRPHMLNPKLMDRLDDVLMRAFQKNPEQRYANCREFARELRDALGVAVARQLDKTLQGAHPPPTEWPTASMTLDADLMKEWQSAARSAAADSQAPSDSAARSGAQSGAKSGARSAARSAATSAARSAATSAARSAATSKVIEQASAEPDATALLPPTGKPAAAPEPAAAKPAKAKKAPRPSGQGSVGGRWLMIAAGAAALAVAIALFMFLGRRTGTAAPADDLAVATDPALDTAAPVDPPSMPQPLPPELASEAAVNADVVDTAGVAVQPSVFKIVTRPAGAAIIVDGKTLEAITPAEIELPPDARHSLELALEGYKPVRWTFIAERLTDDQKRTRTLYFPMASAVAAPAAAPPPAQVAQAPSFSAPPPAAQPEIERPTSPRGQLDKQLATVRGGREVPAPRKIQDAAPVYTRGSVPSGKQPIVILRLTIDPGGEVAKAEVLRGLSPELDEAAKRATYLWRYEVAPYKGKPANTVITSTVVFEGP